MEDELVRARRDRAGRKRQSGVQGKFRCRKLAERHTAFSFLTHHPDGINFIAYGGNWPIAFIQGNSTRLQVHCNGNVGVLEGAPTAPLHVGGAVRVGHQSVAALPDPGSLSAGSIVYVDNATGAGALSFSDGTAWRSVSDRSLVA